MPSQIEANKLVIRELFAKALASSEASAFGAYVERDAIEHVNGGTERFDIGAFRLALGGLASSNISCAIEDVIGESDKVVARLTVRGDSKEHFPSSATGYSTGFTIEHIHIFRLRDGRVIEHWYVRDELQLLEQLGIIPT